ncbi:unnamed protein product [Lathyrus sativus]|nr:unnamed protein product [Lathyrus sativus]
MRTCIMFLILFACQMLVTIALVLSSNTDKLALLALKEKLTNGVSDSLPSWNESLHVCEWEGVTCGRRHMRVIILDLRNQNLGGTLGPSLGNLTFLRNLTLKNITLHGTIPKQIGRLKRLEILQLGDNNLQGEIPLEFANCTNLQGLALQINDLSGNLPSNMHLVFPNLKEFFIAGNQISGNLPSSISNLTKLQKLDISFNAFNGPIPLTLGQLNKLEWFDIANNSFGSGGARDLDFLSSLTNCTQLSALILFQNNFGGELPDLIGNFSSNLSILHMGENQIYGVIPERIGQLTGLTYLNIGINFMEGTIPSSIGKLENLVKLIFQSNNLHGNIPTSIGNLTMLIDLYLNDNKLEGNIPFSLRHCTQLKYLSIFRNKLSGDIPNNTFIYLEGLVSILLENNFLTGPIPLEFGSLKHLSTLALNSNKLSGELPKDLGDCSTLTILSLGGNSFRGDIPAFLGKLSSLEILNISYNNFSSKIPVELEKLTHLNTLDLSFNNLAGEVPTGGVFSNFTSISLVGNKNLCGGVPELKLPACLPLKKHKRFLKRKIVFISVIGGILISFIAFIIVHFLTRKLKRLPSHSLRNGNLRVTYRELHEATNGFSSSNLVGSGSFGSVYKCSHVYFERPIAVKVLNLEARGAAKSFTSECKALGKMKHRNLVKILTCCSSVDYNGEDFKAIVFEFMPNGSLESMLHDNERHLNDNLSLEKRMDIALDVAYALDYLHNDTDQVIVHCDIKPSNVLLDEDMVAHLGDFGLARIIHGAAWNSSKDEVVSSSTIKGTIGYVPPEYGASGSVSPYGDIYSYGILLLEMLTGKRPTDNMFSEGQSLHEFCKTKIPEGILEIVDSRILMPFVEDQTGIVENKIRTCLVLFAGIGVACSEEFPTHRMSIKDVIVKLKEIKPKFPR